MGEADSWFKQMWCVPQGHRHDDVTQLGCIIRVLAALRGEEPALRERVLEAATRFELKG